MYVIMPLMTAAIALALLGLSLSGPIARLPHSEADFILLILAAVFSMITVAWSVGGIVDRRVRTALGNPCPRCANSVHAGSAICDRCGLRLS